MTPQAFVTKWRDSSLKESAAAQSHFNDFCLMLGEKSPTEADPSGAWYAFEKGAAKTGGGDGWADVWKRGCFAWEYKSKGRDLGAALKQLKLYHGALDNPPLLIVSDMEKIEIHTAWTNMVQTVHVFALEDLIDARIRDKLKQAFSETAVEAWKPCRRRADLTAEVAQDFVELAQNLRARGHAADKVAHFVNRCVFCMFAEDVALLPEKLFTKLLKLSLDRPSRFVPNAQRLFAAMAGPNGQLDFEAIEWFNGGLFDDDSALPLERDDIKLALRAAGQDWSNIDPSIMGTLFERGLDPDKRSQLGAHYTDPDKIMMIVNPVIIEPLLREWAGVKAEIEAELAKRSTAKSAGAKTQAFNRATSLKIGFLERLKRFRILDPACGSGNFLYLGLKALKDIEHRVNTDCEVLGLARDFPGVGPENTLGIEINPFAAELARVSIWIGEIQWMREHGFDATRNPILRSLDNIACHDALLNADGTEYAWPTADVIVGNPPFLGVQRMPSLLGTDYVRRLRLCFQAYNGGAVDLVVYWFWKAWSAIGAEKTQRAGLVSTQTIRRGGDEAPLRFISNTKSIFSAWQDEAWSIDGADVRVSLICFGESDVGPSLNGVPVARIFSDLSSDVDLGQKKQLLENADKTVRGFEKGGPFDIEGAQARYWLAQPQNTNGRFNSEVLKPLMNANDLIDRFRDRWVIDFGEVETEEAAAHFAQPYEYLKLANVDEPKRQGRTWWRFRRSGEQIRAALRSHERLIVTPRVSKHRFFCWMSPLVFPDSRIAVVLRSDATTFGVLESKQHRLWSLALGGLHGVGNDPQYTPSEVFETFPFPEGLTPDIPVNDYADDPQAKAIAEAADRLNQYRENWLNPADLVKRVPEVVAGYPDRILPVDDKAAAILKKRTLTNLYNERPAWLDHVHRDLDAAVAAAYGWADWGKGLSDSVILERLFKLNQERVGK